jgi:hypothetical protein
MNTLILVQLDLFFLGVTLWEVNVGILVGIKEEEEEEYLYKRFYPTFVPKEQLLLVYLLLPHGLHPCPDTWEASQQEWMIQ